MRRNDVVFPPPMAVYDTFPQQEQPSSTTTTTTATADALSPSIIITVLVLATAIILSASLFLLLRFLSLYFRRRNPSTIQILNPSLSPSSSRHHSTTAATVPPHRSSIIESLPLFTFSSLTSSSNCDCAVCLSKFEPQDQLRLLPVCCHAFHAECIDAWLANNNTCPLCRSAILISDEDALSKILSSSAAAAPSSGSFRVEIGSVSRRRNDHPGAESGRSTYSIGSSFDYIVDDDAVSEVTVAAAARRPDDKSGESEIGAAALAAEVGGGGERCRGSWLKEYVDRMASSFSLTSSSFRSSGRFFGGSSRRTEVSRVLDSELGDEIGEMFRWLSGV